MKINQDNKIQGIEITLEGAKNLTKKVLVGPDDGSNNIIMRQFTILSGGHTPKHKHNYEHVIKIIRGEGIAVDEKGKEHTVTIGQSIFVAPNDEHQFKNPYTEPFELFCIIPNVEQKM